MAKNKLSAFILLDRSGSMGGAKWENAIGSINQYVESLRKNDVTAEVTVATFDSQVEYVKNEHVQLAREFNVGQNYYNYSKQINTNSFDLIRIRSNINKFKNIEINETSPRGGTPLYDSTAKLINLAQYENNNKTVIIIMTDGEENQSVSESLTSIRSKIASCQERGWEIVFLGAEFNADNTAASYGISPSKVINSSLRSMGDTMSFYASSSAAYAKTGEAINTMSVKDTFSK